MTVAKKGSQSVVIPLGRTQGILEGAKRSRGVSAKKGCGGIQSIPVLTL